MGILLDIEEEASRERRGGSTGQDRGGVFIGLCTLLSLSFRCC